jgi:hypothetical protein
MTKQASSRRMNGLVRRNILGGERRKSAWTVALVGAGSETVYEAVWQAAFVRGGQNRIICGGAEFRDWLRGVPIRGV